MRTSRVAYVVLVVLSLTVTALALPPAKHSDKSSFADFTALIDNTHYIDANNILMFVTNYGSFARDLAGVFGNDYGTYYPYTSVADIVSGVNVTSPLYAAGLWLGGKVNGEIRVTVAEYSSEFVPGPMAGGSYQTDRPEFRVYKLYKDSLASNPNSDYTNWPVNQGAPTNLDGTPLMLGDQMIWTVFNDADPSVHDNDAGDTDPLGIEVQQTVWAFDQPGHDTIFANTIIPVTGSGAEVTAEVVVIDPVQLNGHDYQITVEPAPNVTIQSDPDSMLVWHLDDLTLATRLLANQYNFSGDDNYPVISGFQVIVTNNRPSLFESFEVVANANGPINPPTPGAFAFQGFPTPGDENPDVSVQQATPMNGLGWAIHTGDNGARGSYASFLSRTLRDDPARIAQVGRYDFEIRFTGSSDAPGVGGSYAYEWAQDQSTFWVPIELWRTGIGTPDDPSDDLRLIPYTFGDLDGVYNLSSWGADPNCGPGGCEHSASALDNDPYTGDWIYWRLPADTSPGTAGYDAYEAQMIANPGAYTDQTLPIMGRMVFVYWNGGSAPPFDVNLPEQGTVFRIRTSKVPTDTSLFTFTATDPTTIVTEVGGESNAVYMKFKLINKGGNTITDMFISLWTDPDVGGASDDYVGCDTVNQIWYAYNGTNLDAQFGTAVPAIGFKAISAPSPWNSVNKYINGTDPNDYRESYNYMRGLNSNGSPYTYNGQPTRFVHSGDPVTGTGDLDSNPSDRRLMSSYGPFTVVPNDTIDLEFKVAIGHGSNRLQSITRMIKLLLESNLPGRVHLDIAPGYCPNSLNAHYQSFGDESVLPVAVLGASEFDVREIDKSTITLNGVQPVRFGLTYVRNDTNSQAPVYARYLDLATAPENYESCLCPVATPDGFDDIIVFFDMELLRSSIAAASDVEMSGTAQSKSAVLDGPLRPGETLEPGTVVYLDQVLELTAQHFDGSTIVGYDCVRLNASDIQASEDQINKRPEVQMDIGDLTTMVTAMFRDSLKHTTSSPLDVSGDCKVDITDLAYLVAYMFRAGPAPIGCQ